ncbi:MAG: LysE family translocator, partial [Alphaproteobacteria bacterium]
MLMYDTTHWLTFLVAAMLLNLSPGPDIAFIIGHTLKNGRRAGIVAMLGIWLGAFAHVVFAVAGLSAILMTSATAFTVLKYIGAAYLVWLGIQAIRGAAGASQALRDKSPSETSLARIFRQGFLIDLLNPKVAVFFLAFLPQFVVAGAGPVSLQLFVHGTLIIVVAALIEPPLVLIGDRMARGLRGNTRLLSWLDRGLGAILIA